MTKLTTCRFNKREALAAVTLAFALAGNAMAEGYNFARLIPGGGGGGGADPEKKRIVASMGQYICLDVRERPGNQVMFSVWSKTPQPNARLQTINFSTGRYVNLITGMKVTFQPSGVTSKVVVSPGAGTHFKIYFPYEHTGKVGIAKGGLGPGNMVLISATLGPGQNFANFIRALHESLTPEAERSGLQVWVSGHYFLGGPPPGVATINDDASFALSGPAPQCRR